ncbi:MaoC family dehydratase [Streptomyces sp. NPDC046805]|uniref:MaoC family dehydratase n=1 Tax=Streptomyces sp. NPDC046805 TaxID=3155134 RepID=UPI0033F69713
MTTLTWNLDHVHASRMKTLALILTDPNPIHFDPAEADKLGTGGRLVNQGPSTIALIYNLFAAQVPGKRVRSLSVRLLGNVLEGDAVTVTATATEPDEYDVTVGTPEGMKISGTARLVDRS